jgi:hypothetical protein
VDEREADERYNRLLDGVARTREILIRFGERHWASWTDAVYRDLAAHDAHGFSRLLAAYGGMGSLTDLMIHPANGRSVSEGDIERINDALDQLRSAMYDDASALLRDFERAP